MGVVACIVDCFFQITAEFLVDKMFDAMCRFVNVIEGESKVLDKIRFPKAVRSDQRLRRCTTRIRELKALCCADNVPSSKEHRDSPA